MVVQSCAGRHGLQGTKNSSEMRIADALISRLAERDKLENGKVTAPAEAPCWLIGNGPIDLNRITMINFALDPGIGTCGKSGRGVGPRELDATKSDALILVRTGSRRSSCATGRIGHCRASGEVSSRTRRRQPLLVTTDVEGRYPRLVSH